MHIVASAFRAAKHFIKMTRGPNETSWQAEVARVRAGFNDRGESIAEWSRQHGFHPNAVYQVLGGYTQAMRGNAHRIAVALGIKRSPPPKVAKENSMT